MIFYCWAATVGLLPIAHPVSQSFEEISRYGIYSLFIYFDMERTHSFYGTSLIPDKKLLQFSIEYCYSFHLKTVAVFLQL